MGLSGEITLKDDNLDAYITSLHLVKLYDEGLVIGGLDDGGIAIWQLKSENPFFLPKLDSWITL